MRATLKHQLLLIHKEDVPFYKKSGSVVRNSYFWAMRAIAGRAHRDQDWEYEAEVWVALQRILLSFTASGYLGLNETLLQFPPTIVIPEDLRSVSTWDERT